ncbi:MAG: TldD/PmbA family protein [Candidatus Marinimicrobia bacterium CG_4_10_14_0_2_um_filter_48_9]|nr:MAG: TldD/PmbA family protein [Candidatus Marinimicrobia bacterium CG_4_10_14_0_2_um_filter_48_9]
MDFLNKGSETNKTELAYWAQKYAKQNGADNTSIVISKNRSINVDYRDDKIDQLKESTQNSLWIEIYAGGRYSSHSTNDLRKESLEKFITNAIAMTKFLGEDPFQSLPDPALYQGRPTADLQLYDANYSKMTAEERVSRAKELHDLIKGRDPRLISITSGFSDSHYENTHLKSNGFEGNYENSSFSWGASVSLRGEDDKKPEGWKYYGARHLADLPPSKQIADEAFQRGLDSMGQKKIKSGKMPMLLENTAVGGLFWRVLHPFSAAAIQQKQSFLEGKQGQRIGSENLTLIDDPTIIRGMGSRYYDGDGISAKKLVIVENGVLKNYYVDVYYGRKLGMNPTTGGSSNITFKTGTRSGAEMEADLDRGILVTSFIGGNANSTTGDYSLGISGWLIENGKRVQPVNEMNISGNFIELFENLSETGNDPYTYSSLRAPTLLFDGISFAGA